MGFVGNIAVFIDNLFVYRNHKGVILLLGRGVYCRRVHAVGHDKGVGLAAVVINDNNLYAVFVYALVYIILVLFGFVVLNLKIFFGFVCKFDAVDVLIAAIRDNLVVCRQKLILVGLFGEALERRLDRLFGRIHGRVILGECEGVLGLCEAVREHPYALAGLYGSVGRARVGKVHHGHRDEVLRFNLVLEAPLEGFLDGVVIPVVGVGKIRAVSVVIIHYLILGYGKHDAVYALNGGKHLVGGAVFVFHNEIAAGDREHASQSYCGNQQADDKFFDNPFAHIELLG